MCRHLHPEDRFLKETVGADAIGMSVVEYYNKRGTFSNPQTYFTAGSCKTFTELKDLSSGSHFMST